MKHLQNVPGGMKRHRSAPARGKYIALAALSSIALALTACGSSASPEATASDDAPIDISILRSVTSGFEPLYLAEEQGIWADHGLNVEILDGGSSQDNAAQIISGQVDFSYVGMAALGGAAASDLDVEGIVQVQARVEPYSDGVMVAASSSIESLEDLGGKNVAYGTDTVAISKLLTDAGVDPATVNFVSMPDVSTMAAAVESGTVDAALPYGSAYFAAKTDDSLRIIFEGYTSVAFPDSPVLAIMSSKSFVEENPEAVERFVAAWEEAVAYANEHVDEADALLQEMTGLSDETMALLERQPFDAAVDFDATDELLAAYYEAGAFQKLITADELFSSFTPRA